MKKCRVVCACLVVVLLLAGVLVGGSALAQDEEFEFSAYATSSGGQLGYTDNTFNTAWAAASAETVDSTSNHVEMGMALVGSTYYVQRGYIYFDTSDLPDDCVIETAELDLYFYSTNPETDFDIQLQDGTPTYPHDPLVIGDFDKSNYSDDGGSINTADVVSSAYNTITLNATGEGWISKTGTTKFCLRSSLDIAGTTPTTVDFAYYFTQEYTGTTRDPILTITYSSATGIVETRYADDITATSATLQGELLDLNGYDYGFCYFKYGTTTDYGSVTSGQNITSTTTFEEEITGLQFYTTYYFKAVVKFSNVEAGTSYYYFGDEFEFTTLPASGSSEDIIIKSAAIFTDYLDDDDWLVCVEIINYYTGYYPDKDASKWFLVQLLDDDETTVLGASTLSNWGHCPSSIYINATVAATLTYKDDYYIRCIAPNIGGTPSSDNYALSDSDWYGYDLEALDSWCINTALKMEITDGVDTYITILTDRGLTITDYAGGYFTKGVPAVSQVRPNLFTTSQLNPTTLDTTDSSSWDSADAWETSVGATITADAGDLATPFGMGGKDILAILINCGVLVCMMLIVTGTGGFGALGGFLIAFPLIWLGTYFKIIPVAEIVIIAIFFGALAIRQFVVKTT